MFGSSCGVFVVILVVFGWIIPARGQSPCPQIFRYQRDEMTGEIMGRIEIPGAPKNVALHLRITLSVATALPTKYVGRLELASSRADAVRAVHQGKPLAYRVYFPLRHPIPLLTEITFNGQRYCVGSRAAGPIVTSIFLEHTLYPPGVIHLSDNSPPTPTNNDAMPNIPPAQFDVNGFNSQQSGNPTIDSNLIPILTPGTKIPTYIKIEPPTERPPPKFNPIVPNKNVVNPHLEPSLNDDRENCGRANYGGVNYLIAHGERTTPGQWPWIAAIFVAKLEYEFQCGGSLVTEKHVITAAHCKISNDVDVPASAFLVALGRYQLDDWREEGSKTFEVLEFQTHPEYRSRASADADLAIIVLRDKAQFTPRIQPICLWSGPSSLEGVVSLNGHVVGWGRDEHGNQHLKQPRLATAPIVSQEDCLRSNIAFVPSTSNRTFCAGRRDGSGPCNGDSGSGFVILDSASGRYNLRGVVSLSLLDKNTMSCDLSQYLVYVDIAKYLDWIKTQIKK